MRRKSPLGKQWQGCPRRTSRQNAISFDLYGTGGGAAVNMRTNRASRKAMELRRKLGLHGQVDAEAVANMLGLTMVPLKLESLQELMVDDCIGVAERLATTWRRWVIVHSIGHKPLHHGNHMWMRINTGLGNRLEREAEDFAHAFPIDVQESLYVGVVDAWEVAEYFGFPEELVLLQAPLFPEGIRL